MYTLIGIRDALFSWIHHTVREGGKGGGGGGGGQSYMGTCPRTVCPILGYNVWPVNFSGGLVVLCPES